MKSNFPTHIHNCVSVYNPHYTRSWVTSNTTAEPCLISFFDSNWFWFCDKRRSSARFFFFDFFLWYTAMKSNAKLHFQIIN